MTDHLILLAGFPAAGQSKARFIPTLGPDGASRLHRRLVEHTVAAARRWRASGRARHIFIACDGATSGEFRGWLGEDLYYDQQCGGSLGARLAVASVRAFTRGADRVVLAVTDCPGLDTVQMARAFFSLDQVDCVIGPNLTGGYYLIGLVIPTPAIFAGIPWSTGAQLTRTMAAARQENLRVGVMPMLPVIGGPRDLIHAAEVLAPLPSRS